MTSELKLSRRDYTPLPPKTLTSHASGMTVDVEMKGDTGCYPVGVCFEHWNDKAQMMVETVVTWQNVYQYWKATGNRVTKVFWGKEEGVHDYGHNGWTFASTKWKMDETELYIMVGAGAPHRAITYKFRKSY